MKSLLYILLMFVMVQISISEQVTVKDSVETGVGYKDEIFYNLQSGLKSPVTANNWDIAFEILGAGYSVNNNGGFSVQVYHKSDLASEDFDKSYTSEEVQKDWKQLYNSTETWAVGAFVSNKDPLNDYDLGWGEYSMATHSVYAKTFYVIKTVSGKWKKVIIDDLTNRIYTFRISNLDGTDLIERKINKNDYANKNFAYYSIDNNVFIDREPVLTDWDLNFSKYINMEGENKDTPYSVTGIRTNPYIKSVRVGSENPSTESVPAISLFKTNITNIGSDWKKFNGTQYVVSDSLVFFVYRTDNQKFYRLLFNGFAGSSTGKYNFSKEELEVSSIQNDDSQSSFSVYPSIINSGENFNLIVNTSDSEVNVRILSLEGKLVDKFKINPSNDLQNISVKSGNLSSGLYLINYNSNNKQITQKIIIR